MIADPAACADHAVCADLRACADVCVFADYGERADAGALADFCERRKNRSRMNSRGDGSLFNDESGSFSKCHFRMCASQNGLSLQSEIFWRDYAVRGRRFGAAHKFGFLDIDKIVRAGALGGRYTAQFDGAVSFEYRAQCIR